MAKPVFLSPALGRFRVLCGERSRPKHEKLVIAPKIGGFLAYGPIILGNDFSLYTDFSESSLRWIPYFGLGGNRFKLTINPHVTLSNKDFFENRLPSGHLHLSYALINFYRRKTDGPR